MRAEDILCEYANRIRLNALHVTINSTNTRASLEVVKLVKFSSKIRPMKNYYIIYQIILCSYNSVKEFTNSQVI